MSLTRRMSVVVLAVVTALGAQLLGGASSALAGGTRHPVRPPVEVLLAQGVCPMPDGVSKDVEVMFQPQLMWLPLQLLDDKSVTTGYVLFPYQITADGEAILKHRHLVPGETYTRPGRPPRNPVTCEFSGVSRTDGPFTLEIVGAIY